MKLRFSLRRLAVTFTLAVLAGCGSRPESAIVPAGARVPAPATRAPTRPNIVLIIADDLGWRDVGFMGSTYYETPNLDALARAGMTFTAGYSNAPNCAPTRASLLTGQYTPRHGIYTVGTSERGDARDRKLIPTPNREVLPLGLQTIAEALRPAGYVSAHVGKWHLGRPPETGPEAQGFHRNVAGNGSGAPASYFSPYRNPQLADGPAGEYLTDRLTSEAISFIQANRDRPFFLYLPYYAVHTPLQAKPELVEKYRAKSPSEGQKNPVYAAMVESLDQGVGRVLRSLEELGLAENTLVIFTSDNGGHGVSTSNLPLRGAKGMLYEGGIRVPLAFRWPAMVRPGSRNETPAMSADLFSTVLEIGGAAPPAGQPIDGVSLVPLLRGAPALGREAIFWHTPVYLEAYPGQPEPGNWRATPSSAVRAGDWKLIESFETGGIELFNLREDPNESRDLAPSMPAKAGELRARLTAWRASVRAPVPSQPNPAYDPPEPGEVRPRRPARDDN